MSGVRVLFQQRIELVIQRRHAFPRTDGIYPIDALPDGVDLSGAFARLFLRQLAAHQRIDILLKSCEMAFAADEVCDL